MKWIKQLSVLLLSAFAISYVIICIFFYFEQDSIILKPIKLEKDFPVTYDFNFEERYFQVEEGINIHAVHARADSSKGLIFFCHGNLGNVQTNPGKFDVFLDLGYDVLYPDYRGFGKSDGYVRNEADLVEDIYKVYEQIKTEYSEENIIVLGYSLGSGIAAQIAARSNPRNLMLWTPYYSMVDMKQATYPYLPTFLMKYPLRTDLVIQEIEEPITIIYAEEDQVLPINLSMKLNNLLKPSDEYLILEGQRHGGIYFHPEFVSKLPQMLEKQQ